VSESWVSNALELAKGTVQLSTELAKISPSIIRYPLTFRSPSKVVSALEQFQECVRYLNTRRSEGAIINIKSEDDLQDVIFLMLRPWITDLVTENPTDRIASRFVIQDFLSKELNIVVEAKFVRDKKHGRKISEELHDDIETYRNHPNCSEIVFFIYDPNSLIPDSVALRKQIQGERDYDGKKLNVYCVVKP
jgi:hypothetical protein